MKVRRSSPTRSPRAAGSASIPLIPDAVNEFYGLGLLAIVAGVAFAVVLTRTRFGFDLRATGQSESAAVASGVNVKRMVDLLDAAVGCGRGSDRDAAAVR